MLNKGASFLVSPANLSYKTKASKVIGKSHVKVIQGLEDMLKKHEEEQNKKLKGLSEEMIAKAKNNKSPQVRNIERLINKV